jgi:hypothetical protein
VANNISLARFVGLIHTLVAISSITNHFHSGTPIILTVLNSFWCETRMMPHQGILDSRTRSGLPHSAVQNRPNNLRIPYRREFRTKNQSSNTCQANKYINQDSFLL